MVYPDTGNGGQKRLAFEQIRRVEFAFAHPTAGVKFELERLFSQLTKCDKVGVRARSAEDKRSGLPKVFCS